MDYFNYSVAILLLRLVLGILMFAQAYDKIFRIGLAGVLDAYRSSPAISRFPHFVTRTGTFLTSYIELAASVFLMAGLFTTYSLWALSLSMVITAAGFSMQQPLWDMRHYFPRLVMLAVLLMLPADFDSISLDYLLFKTR